LIVNYHHPPDFSHITMVIFDMDGTLIQHTWQLSQICQTLFAEFAAQLAPATEEEFFDCYWEKSMDMWHMMVDGVIDGETAAVYGYANTLRQLGQDPGLGEAMLHAWRKIVLEEAVPFEDTYRVLDAVRQKYTTGILSNGFTILQRQKITKYNLADYVDFTLISEEAGCHKPDKQIFFKALKLAGPARPDEALYIGDNPEADIIGARSAGLTPIFINTNNYADPPAGVVQINTLSELLPLLNL
jgi:HAD superfamily hydrolase (TIGR01549 family)